MAERLTKEYYYTWDENGTKKLSYIQKLQNKLGKLEDILEKYGIWGVEELEELLDDNKYAQNVVVKQLVELQNAKTDRDTWKRACELACREAPLHCPNPPEYYNAQDEYGSDEPYYIQEGACEFSDDAERCLECQINYFYQQAKKERNDE